MTKTVYVLAGSEREFEYYCGQEAYNTGVSIRRCIGGFLFGRMPHDVLYRYIADYDSFLGFDKKTSRFVRVGSWYNRDARLIALVQYAKGRCIQNKSSSTAGTIRKPTQTSQFWKPKTANPRLTIVYGNVTFKAKGVKVKMPRGTRTARQPKPPKLVLQKPSHRDLKDIYDGVISYESTTRLNALARAFQWYDSAIGYLADSGKLPADAAPVLDKAVKCRKQGISSSHDAEKETAYKMALSRYETVCVSLKPPPLADVYKKLDEKKDKLRLEAERFEAKYYPVINALMDSLQPLGASTKPITISVARVEKAKEYHPEMTKLVYNCDLADKLLIALKQDGILPVVVSEIFTLSRAAALQQDANGKYTCNPIKQIESIEHMLKRFVQYCKESGSIKLLFAKNHKPSVSRTTIPPPAAIAGLDTIPPPPTPKTVSPKQPRITKPRTGAKVGGMFTPETAVADIWLLLSDQQSHLWGEIDKLAKDNGHDANVRARVNRILRAGKSTGKWSIQSNKQQVQMLLA